VTAFKDAKPDGNHLPVRFEDQVDGTLIFTAAQAKEMVTARSSRQGMAAVLSGERVSIDQEGAADFTCRFVVSTEEPPRQAMTRAIEPTAVAPPKETAPKAPPARQAAEYKGPSLADLKELVRDTKKELGTDTRKPGGSGKARAAGAQRNPTRRSP